MGKLKTHEEFIVEVYELVGDEYIVIGDYVGNHTKILLFHSTCGYKYAVLPTNFISNRSRCPNCCGKKKKTTSQFKKEIKSLVGHDYKVLGEYNKSYEKILFLHADCGYEYEVTPNVFLSGARCPRCMGRERKTPARFREEVFNLVGYEYDVIGDYTGSMDKVLFRHSSCGFEYYARPSQFLQNRRCPKCASEQTQSKLATFLKKYFKENHEALDEYYDCPSPRGKGYLPYDIYIPSHKIYVEVHGLQHYEKVDFYYPEQSAFEKRLLYDKVKKEHAERNGIYVEIDIREHDFVSAVKLIESKIL